MNRRYLYAVPWASMMVCAAAGAIAPEHSARFGTYALLASVLMFGLPHGACDLWAFAVARGRQHSFGSTAFFLFTYLLAAALALLLWFLSAPTALSLFLILTVWHFGSGDARLEHGTRAAWLLAGAGRGLIVIAAPLVFYPEESAAVLGGMASVAGETVEVGVWLRPAPWLLAAGLAAQLGGTLVGFGVGSDGHAPGGRRAKPVMRLSSAARVWTETALLILMFRYAPPLLAVACYFIGVHAWRHIVRLATHADADGSPHPRGLWQILREFHRRALLFTLLALAGLALLVRIFPAPFFAPGRWTTLYLVLLAVLTVPHVLIVGWLDRHENDERGIYDPDAGST